MHHALLRAHTEWVLIGCLESRCCGQFGTSGERFREEDILAFWHGNFDSIFGPSFAHFKPPRAPCAVAFYLAPMLIAGCMIGCMIGACKPMLCRMWGFRTAQQSFNGLNISARTSFDDRKIDHGTVAARESNPNLSFVWWWWLADWLLVVRIGSQMAYADQKTMEKDLAVFWDR